MTRASRTGLVVIALSVAALATHWSVSRRHARRGAEALHSAAVALAACAADRAPPQQVPQLAAVLATRVELALAGSRPLAACAGPAQILVTAATAQRATIFHRSPAEVTTLARVADDLARFAWSRTARELAATDKRGEHLADLLDRALAGACDIAVAEDIFTSPPCPHAGPERPVSLPTPHSALEVTLGTPVGEVRWSAAARKDTIAIAVSATSANRLVTGTFLSVRRGTGRWAQIDVETARSTGDAPLVAPTVAFVGDRPTLILDGQHDRLGTWRGVVSSIDVDHATSTRAYSIESLSAGLTPVSVGSPLLTLPAIAATAIVSNVRPGALFELVANHPPSRRFAPPGRLIAAWNGDRPRVAVVTDDAQAPALSVYAAPAAGATWPAPATLADPAVASLVLEPGGVAQCGDDLIATGTAHDRRVLVQLGAGAPRVTPVPLHAGSTASVVCGVCGPAVLERAGTNINWLPGDGSKPRAIELPVIADRGAIAGATAICTPNGVILAYIARGVVIVQRDFGPPTIVAHPTPDGAPGELVALTIGSRAMLLWRRAKRGTPEVAIEYVESEDGVTWR